MADGTIRWHEVGLVRELVGSDLPEVTSFERWAALIHPDDRGRHMQEAAAALEAGGGRLEFRIRRGDGEIRWLEATGRVVARDADGRPVAVGGVTMDISARRVAETALREAEARFRAVFDSDLLGLTVFDAATGETLAVNDRALRLMDCTREEFESGARGWRQVTPLEHLARDEAAIRQVLTSGHADPFEKEYLRKDGTRVPVRLTLAPLPGQPSRVVIGIEDLSEAHAADAALRESEARFRALTDLAPSFIWFGTPDGSLHYLNDRWYAFTGQTPEEALPDGWAATLHPDDVAPTSARWAEARASGQTYEIEVRYRRRDGEYRWYIARAEPLRDADGAITGWFGSSTDIHDRKLAEAALAESEARFRTMADSAPVMIWTSAPTAPAPTSTAAGPSSPGRRWGKRWLKAGSRRSTPRTAPMRGRGSSRRQAQRCAARSIGCAARTGPGAGSSTRPLRAPASRASSSA
jgi:PAS domain S-box-containing protein